MFIVTNTLEPITFAMIAWDVSFHMGWEQLHAFPSTTFNSFCQWINIVLTKNGIHTLVNVVIVDPTWVNLLPQFCAIQGFVAFDVTQVKEKSYRNRHPINQFFPLAIDVIWLLTETCRCAFTRFCKCHLELEKTKGPSSFYLGHFFLSKNFNHITKDASVLHLKLGGNWRLNYFPIFTLSQHTSHHHGQPIASCRFLTWRNMTDLL